MPEPSTCDPQCPRPAPQAVGTVALVGAGLIGASWAAYLLGQGLTVTAFDPDPSAPDRLAESVAKIWPVMGRAAVRRMEGEPGTVAFGDLEAVCASADLILESGPEDLALKRDLIARIDAAAAHATVIASCSSALLPSDYQTGAARPERVLAAHPFNPPALVPLVEVAGGARTDPAALDWATAFFTHIGKRPIRLHRETPGYVANRMASALYREAVDLVATGVATVADVDAAVRFGPGLRWAALGPHLIYHLAGGEGGYRGYLGHLGPSQEARWRTLGASALTPAVQDALVQGVEAEIAALAIADLGGYRDAALAELLRALSSVEADARTGSSDGDA